MNPQAIPLPRVAERRETTLVDLLLATDAPSLARRNLCCAFFHLVCAVLAAVMMRAELLTAPLDLMQPRSYGALLSLHGTLMVYFVGLPAAAGVLGHALLPALIGVAGPALPRLARLSWWLLAAGGGIVLAGFTLGGTEAGWSFDTAFGGRFTHPGLAPAALGVLLGALGLGLLHLNTLATLRARRQPLGPLACALHGSALLLLVAVPVLVLCLGLVLADLAFGFSVFDVAAGGDPALFSLLFSLFSTPALNTIVLSGFGIAAHILLGQVHEGPRDARRFRQLFALMAMFGLFAGNRPLLDRAGADLPSVLALMCTGGFILTSILAILFSLALVRRGLRGVNTSVLCALGFLITLAGSAGSGLLLALPGTRDHLANTTFHSAHLHATLGGALGLAFLGGLHLAWTPMTGRRFSEMAGRIAAVMIFAASHLTHWPLYVLGRAGAPFRANSFPVEHLVLQVASTAGFTLLLVGLVIAAVNLGAGGRRAVGV